MYSCISHTVPILSVVWNHKKLVLWINIPHVIFRLFRFSTRRNFAKYLPVKILWEKYISGNPRSPSGCRCSTTRASRLAPCSTSIRSIRGFSWAVSRRRARRCRSGCAPRTWRARWRGWWLGAGRWASGTSRAPRWLAARRPGKHQTSSGCLESNNIWWC